MTITRALRRARMESHLIKRVSTTGVTGWILVVAPVEARHCFHAQPVSYVVARRDMRRWRVRRALLLLGITATVTDEQISHRGPWQDIVRDLVGRAPRPSGTQITLTKADLEKDTREARSRWTF